jgi:hypothetical protein
MSRFPKKKGRIPWQPPATSTPQPPQNAHNETVDIKPEFPNESFPVQTYGSYANVLQVRQEEEERKKQEKKRRKERRKVEESSVYAVKQVNIADSELSSEDDVMIVEAPERPAGMENVPTAKRARQRSSSSSQSSSTSEEGPRFRKHKKKHRKRRHRNPSESSGTSARPTTSRHSISVYHAERNPWHFLTDIEAPKFKNNYIVYDLHGTLENFRYDNLYPKKYAKLSALLGESIGCQ